jgi:hypothetical protein
MWLAVCMACIPLIMLSLIRSFKELSTYTTVGVGAILAAVILVLLNGLVVGSDMNTVLETPLFLPDIMGYVGPSTFLLAVHYCVLSVGAESLRERSDEKDAEVSCESMSRPLRYAYYIGTAVITGHGATSYVLYREANLVRSIDGSVEQSCVDRICQNIVLNLPPGLLK